MKYLEIFPLCLLKRAVPKKDDVVIEEDEDIETMDNSINGLCNYLTAQNIKNKVLYFKINLVFTW